MTPAEKTSTSNIDVSLSLFLRFQLYPSAKEFDDRGLGAYVCVFGHFPIPCNMFGSAHRVFVLYIYVLRCCFLSHTPFSFMSFRKRPISFLVFLFFGADSLTYSMISLLYLLLSFSPRCTTVSVLFTSCFTYTRHACSCSYLFCPDLPNPHSRHHACISS